MDTFNKDEKFWDRTAKYYDNLEENDVSYMMFVEKTRKYLVKGDIVLDFGCGTGLVCNEIAQNVKKIYAIDISSKMIEISKAKMLEQKIQNIEYLHTTIFDEIFKNNSIDVIIIFNVLHLLKDVSNYIQRISELLKSGGMIISATPCMKEKPLLNYFLKIGFIVKLIPKIKSYKYSEIDQFFANEKFAIIENYALKPNSPLYFFIAKKL